MPHWVVWLAIIVAAWMMLAVVGGWLIGRGLGAIERRSGFKKPEAERNERPRDLRRAA